MPVSWVNVIHQGDALETLRRLPAECVQTCITSPPYWGLRDYQTGTWEGGDPHCSHEPNRLFPASTLQGGKTTHGMAEFFRAECPKCGARRIDQQLGLEPTPDEYVARLVEIFREVRRVLRADGTCWLNLGNSYARDAVKGQHKPGDGGKQAYVYDRGGGRASVAADLQTTGLKPKDLVGIPWRVAFALQADGWWLRSDIIWCLSGGTYVYVRGQKGDMPMMVKDIARLRPESIQLWNGQKWTRLKGMWLSKRTGEDIEIELRSGERIACTPGHWWPTTSGLKEARDIKVGDVLLSCQLPEPEDVVSPEHIPDKIGWFVGMYLAEGSRDSTDTIQIACHVDEVEKRFVRLMEIASKYGGTCRVHYKEGNGATICLNGKLLNAVVDTYIYGNKAKNKCLRSACWQRSNRFLDYLLRGYLEGDGHWEPQNNRWRVAFTRNYNLERDLRTLCARLRYALTLRLSEHRFNGKNHKTFCGEIRFGRAGHWNEKDRNEIMAIRKSRARQFWDIEVEDEPHVFALGSGILTHNSKPNPMPESVTDRPTMAHEYIFLLAKSEKYFYDHVAIQEKGVVSAGARGAKGSVERAGTPGVNSRPPEYHVYNGKRNKRSVWHINTKPFPEAHFAVFPEELVVPCILAGSSPKACSVCRAPWERLVIKERSFESGSGRSGNLPVGKHGPGLQGGGQTMDVRRGPVVHISTTGWQPTCSCDNNGSGRCIVLDPFMGSGTTAVVAAQLGRDFIGIELNPEYVAMAERRVKPYLAQQRFDVWT